MAETGGNTNGRTWHFDKAIPVTLILAVLAQTFALGFGAASIIGRLNNIEASLVGRTALIERFVTIEREQGYHALRLSTLESDHKALKRGAQ